MIAQYRAPPQQLTRRYCNRGFEIPEKMNKMKSSELPADKIGQTRRQSASWSWWFRKNLSTKSPTAVAPWPLGDSGFIELKKRLPQMWLKNEINENIHKE